MVGEVIVPPARKLEDLIRLADLCVDLLRQNEEFYAEVSPSESTLRMRRISSSWEPAFLDDCFLSSEAEWSPFRLRRK